MFRKFNSIILPVGLALAMLLSACAQTTSSTAVPTAAPGPSPIALTDGLGREVTLDAPAQRIISIAPSNTEILFAIGAGAQVIGRDDLSDYPAEAANVTSIGSTYDKLNTEAIVALEPDLVLAAEINSPEHVTTLEDLGLNVYWLANPTTYDGLYDNLQIVGQLTGRTAEAEQLVDLLKQRYAAVLNKVGSATTKPRVFYEVDGTDPLKPWTTGPGTFMDAMISLAGGENVGAVLQDPFAQVSSEELVRQDPDIIVLGDALYGVTVESIGERAGWDGITAVKNSAIYTFDDNLASRPGPRLIDGLEELAKMLHPESFE